MTADILSVQTKVRRWIAEPPTFVWDQFGATPEAWQEDALNAVGGPPNPRRLLCLLACTGPGKSTVLNWIGWHRLFCFASKGEHPKGAALSITGKNLKDNLWAEFAKWKARSPLLDRAFEWTKEQIFAKDHPETWFLSARAIAADANAEAIGQSLSGLHSKFPFVLLDETGSQKVPVGRAAMQIFTGDPEDALVAQAGNPTDVTGLLYDSVSNGKYKVIRVTADPDDPKRTNRVSVEHAREMIALYGRDNPWVMATILGQFPPCGFNSLFGIEEVEQAMERTYKEAQLEQYALILGGDVARQGDDSSVLARRKGPFIWPLDVFRIPDTMVLAAQIGQRYQDYEADAAFIDGTGGWGANVVDGLRHLNLNVTGVLFGGKDQDPMMFNKRSGMYFRLSQWIKAGGALPKDRLLRDELVATTYTYTNDLFRIVEKDIIKATLGRSPDRADGVALTFAFPAVKRAFTRRKRSGDYNPYDRMPKAF